MTDTQNREQIKTAADPQEQPVSIVVGNMSGVAMEDFAGRESVFSLDKVNVHYGQSLAVKDVSLEIYKNQITAFIGPSGCGKTTILRCLNRMNDLIPSAQVTGSIKYHGEEMYAPEVDPVQVRKMIGMVFQKPNPFPKSIYDNVAFGPRTLGISGSMDEIVEKALRDAALWDDVKDRLNDNAYGMSGGQQQRLCIARAIAVKPEVILMDEPCSALDPVSTFKIEDLMMELKKDYTIVIVTHNMQQAGRVADLTAFFSVVSDDDAGSRTGQLVEYDTTNRIFSNPQDERTRNYVTGRFG